jgi:alpha-galactosidase
MYLALSDEGKKAFMASDLGAVKAELEAIGKDFNEFKSFGQFGRHEITTNLQGVNHFTWINKAEHDGLDLMPIYAAYIKMFRENNIKRCGKGVPAIKKRFRNVHNVKFTLFEKYGVTGAAGDRHLAEFVPELFLTSKHVLQYGFELTPVWGRMLANRLLVLMTALAGTPLYNPKIKGSGEEGIRQISAICGLGDIVTNVNLPNKGQLQNGVPGAAVETNAAFSLDSVVALDAGEMVPGVAALVNLHAQNQVDFVEAYFQRDKDALEAVFCRDPQVARIGPGKGKKLFAEMRAKNRECLEDFLL